MSAANASVPSHSFQDEARANEPSMEEILASIRRILADDDNLPGVRRDDRRRPRADEAPARNIYPAPILERRQDETPAPLAFERRGETKETGDVRPLHVPASESGEEAEAAPSLEDKPSKNERVLKRQDHTVEVRGGGRTDETSLLSAETARTVASQFQALAAGVAFTESDILDKCAQELLRPLLQQWLNDHLPSLVERVVRAEIERIARSGLRPSSPSTVNQP